VNVGVSTLEEKAACRGDVVGTVGVHHEAHPGTHGFTDSMDVLDVGLDPEADLQLHSPEAFGGVTTGVFMGTYEPAGEIVTGSFALD
jgi:hypothetical protein